ncbi:hypothetical protein LINPERHAP2_LOCUS14411, partial [Linum perenne]
MISGEPLYPRGTTFGSSKTALCRAFYQGGKKKSIFSIFPNLSELLGSYPITVVAMVNEVLMLKKWWMLLY